MAKSEEVITTGISATLGNPFCRFDDTRAVILQQARSPHGEGYDINDSMLCGCVDAADDFTDANIR